MTPATLADLETPVPLVDLDRLERNLAEMATIARAAGVALRPHAKTHKSAAIGRRQVAAGAAGLTVALVDEAEALVGAGVTDDVLVAYPVVERGKAARLAALLERARIAVFADSPAGLEALASGAAASRASRPLDVVLEIDCGQRRSGVAPGSDALLDLARRVGELPGLRLKGVATHAGHVYRSGTPGEVAAIAAAEGEAVTAAARRLVAAGFAVEMVSAGSTPTAAGAARVDGLTEIRPGTYVFHDRTQVALGVVPLARCALAVLTTCVSRPAPDRAVLDAGAKALALDRIEMVSGYPGYGALLRLDGAPLAGAVIERLSEEHAVAMGEGLPLVGERLLVVPNHCCPVVNLFDRLYGVRGGRIEEVIDVSARGHRAGAAG